MKFGDTGWESEEDRRRRRSSGSRRRRIEVAMWLKRKESEATTNRTQERLTDGGETEATSIEKKTHTPFCVFL